jgi:heterodisulfide reductase subunit A
MNEIRMGVFLCECGDQISSTLDMESLEKQVREHPLAKEVRKLRYACSPDGLATIQEAIQKNGLDGVVIAGCTPRTMAHRFRGAFKKAELELDRFELVDIREGCAWVHSATPQSATDKAINLIRMGIVRAAQRQPSRSISFQSTPTVLVIGGGLSGMTAALVLANAGVPVKLVEREATLGGILRQVHTLFPDHRNAASYLADKVDAVSHNARIDTLLQCQVTAISSNIGHYRVRVGRLPTPRDGEETFEVGAIIVATGARILSPQGVPSPDGGRVVTQWAFEKELIQAGNG